MSVLLTQTATVVFRVTYDRHSMIEILTDVGGQDPGALVGLSERELAEKLVATLADENDVSSADVSSRVVEDAGEYEDTEVYG